MVVKGGGAFSHERGTPVLQLHSFSRARAFHGVAAFHSRAQTPILSESPPFIRRTQKQTAGFWHLRDPCATALALGPKITSAKHTAPYRGTSLIRTRNHLGTYSRTMPMVLRRS